MLKQIAKSFRSGILALFFVVCWLGGAFLVFAGVSAVSHAIFGGAEIVIGLYGLGMFLIGIVLFGTAVRLLTE